MALVPAALIPKRFHRQKHVLDRCGIVLCGEASIPIGIHSFGQNTDRGRSCLCYRRVDHSMQPLKNMRIINCNQAGCLHVASGWCSESRFQNCDQILSRHRFISVFSAVAVTVHDRFYDIHCLLLISQSCFEYSISVAKAQDSSSGPLHSREKALPLETTPF